MSSALRSSYRQWSASRRVPRQGHQSGTDGTFGPSSSNGGRASSAGMEIDRNGLEVLDRAECLRLLSTATLGRIGVQYGALPTVLPVNFVLDGCDIVIRTGRGTKLDAATDN